MTNEEEHWLGVPDSYDLRFHPSLTVLRLSEADRAELEAAAGAEGGVVRDRSLCDVRRYLKAICDAGGSGAIIPARYRMPRVNPQVARELAQRELDQLRATSRRPYGELSEATNGRLWWVFYADDVEAQEAGLIPGAAIFAVDKWDGRMRTEAELANWLRFSKGE